MVRIISGSLKGILLPTLNKKTYRPTKSKIREAVFSAITSINNGIFLDDTKILDLFCGTGAYAFEAISRGAGSALLIDNDTEHLKLVKFAAEKLLLQDRVKTLKLNAADLPPAKEKFHLVFIDPPYGKNLIPVALRNLGGWLEDEALVVIESEKYFSLNIAEGYELLLERVYGNSKVYMLLFTRKKSI